MFLYRDRQKLIEVIVKTVQAFFLPIPKIIAPYLTLMLPWLLSFSTIISTSGFLKEKKN